MKYLIALMLLSLVGCATAKKIMVNCEPLGIELKGKPASQCEEI